MHEPSWTQRLFGPVGREAFRAPFDPVDVHQWAELVGGNQVGEQSTLALNLLRQLGAQRTRRGRLERPLTGGICLAPCGRRHRLPVMRRY